MVFDGSCTHLQSPYNLMEAVNTRSSKFSIIAVKRGDLCLPRIRNKNWMRSKEMNEKYGAGASVWMPWCEHVSRDPVVPQVKGDSHSLKPHVQ